MSKIVSRKINKISLINFQNHKSTSIDLTNGLNLLVGSSDSGKTAIARAIDFVLHNHSEGNDYVHIGEKFATVIIEFADGAIIKRSKGERLNKVEYKYPDDFDFTLRASFDKNYPEDVVAFLGNPPKSKLLGAMSYSNQSNKNFLVDLPEGQIPGVISDLVGVSDLEDGASILSTKVRNLDVEIKTIEKNITQIETKLEDDFINLDDKVDKTKLIKNLISEIEDLDKLKLNMLFYYDKLKSINTRGADARGELKKANSIINTLKEKIDYLKNIKQEYSDKTSIFNSSVSKLNEIKSAEKELKKYKALSDGKLKKLLQNVSKMISNLESQLLLNNKLQTNISDSNDLEIEINECDLKIEKLQFEKDQTIDDIKSNEFYCSECNTAFGVKI